MPILRFPDPRMAGPDGIVALGGNLQSETLLRAYRKGIFPWPMDGFPLVWVSPEERGILEFDRLSIPRTLRQARKRSTYRITIDEDFRGVISRCSRIRRTGQPGTWITSEIISSFCRFHKDGHAHSVEVWEEEKLVGGLYGVDVDGVFAGESMFHMKPNASKLALLFLIDHLRERGLDWIDIQTMTPHMQMLGAIEIPRDEFLEKLAATRAKRLRLFD